MTSRANEQASRIVKNIARGLGFDFCGISRAEFLENQAPKLEHWLSQGYSGKMTYMGNHFDKRLDPTLLVPGAKSVVSLMYNYYPDEKMNLNSDYKISQYAYGKDYHNVIRKKLKSFITRIKEQIGETVGRGFVDSAPVMERAWAMKSGLGWTAKNTQVINRKMGSFFFLAELIIDLELVPDDPVKDHCGTCTRCIDACPTNALQSYMLDASKCISYLTIELKNQIPDQFEGKMNGWIFGCDICQDVCPWNRHAKSHKEMAFNLNPDIKNMTNSDWEEITEEIFETLFKGSAVKRTGFKGLKRNIKFTKVRP
ncbi:tRNA epoxyqueuosine(34) reductase QueG [Bacteroidota bacterium]